MRIRRSRLAADYVQIPNGTVRDDRLSYMARGILAELLSRPEGWEDTADNMWRRAAETRGGKGEGRRAFRAAFAELKECGYLVAEREQLPGGKHATVLTAYDVPAGRADVPHVGMSADAQVDVSAGRADVPYAGTSDFTDVPHAGMSAPPGRMAIPAGRADVPLSDVPHAGTSNRRRSKNTSSSTPATDDGQTGSEADGEERVPDAFAYIQPLIRAMTDAGIVVSWQMQADDIHAIARVLKRAGSASMVKFALDTKATVRDPIRFATFFLRGWKGLPPKSDRPRDSPTNTQPSMPPYCGDPDCDPVDRTREVERPDGIRVNVPCKKCHPDMNRSTP